jgi:hypothetical protein
MLAQKQAEYDELLAKYDKLKEADTISSHTVVAC